MKLRIGFKLQILSLTLEGNVQNHQGSKMVSFIICFLDKKPLSHALSYSEQLPTFLLRN